jgi:hypothetical protein
MADDASKGIDFGPTTHIDLGPRLAFRSRYSSLAAKASTAVARH